MKVVRMLFRRRYLLALFAITLIWLTVPSVAHGQTCCIATSAIMDDEGEVEATVEMAANQSEVEGYVEVDNFSYELYEDIEYVGAEGDLYDGNSLASSSRTITNTMSLLLFLQRPHMSAMSTRSMDGPVRATTTMKKAIASSCRSVTCLCNCKQERHPSLELIQVRAQSEIREKQSR